MNISSHSQCPRLWGLISLICPPSTHAFLRENPGCIACPKASTSLTPPMLSPAILSVPGHCPSLPPWAMSGLIPPGRLLSRDHSPCPSLEHSPPQAAVRWAHASTQSLHWHSPCTRPLAERLAGSIAMHSEPVSPHPNARTLLEMGNWQALIRGACISTAASRLKSLHTSQGHLWFCNIPGRGSLLPPEPGT